MDREPVGQAESVAAQRAWWDAQARDYYQEHGSFLGDAKFVWGPEGWTEAELQLLSPTELPPGPILEIGAGAAQCSRWLAAQGRTVVASDLSGGMLAQGAAIARRVGGAIPLMQADGARLPFADAAFAVVFTAYGVMPFVADAAAVLAQAARVLVPGGRFVFATTHPIRWAFPDVPGEAGLTATQSYWDTRPYVERGPAAGLAMSSTTGPPANGCAWCTPRGWCCAIWSSRSGPSALPKTGAAGHRRGGASYRARRSSSATNPARASHTGVVTPAR